MMNINNIFDEQFVCIGITDGTTPQQMMLELIGMYPVLESVGWILDGHTALFNVADDIKYGFSLNSLRDRLGSRASVELYAPGMDS